MPSNFPSSPDDIQNDVGNSTLEVDLHPALHNQLADSVMAVQTELLAGGTMNLAAHVAAADPHAGYLTPAEGDARYALTPVTVPDGSITSAKIADGTVTSGDMAAGAAATNVGTLGGALTGTLPNPGLAALPANSVGASQITDLSVGTAELADGAVTSAKIADGTIATADLADRSVTNIKLGTDTARANLLTNGGFEINQRGAGPWTSGYTSDRWIIEGIGLSVTVSGVGADVDDGSQFCVSVVYTAPNSSNLTQSIEAFGLRRRLVSMSARVKTTTAAAIRLMVTSDGTSPVPVTSNPHSGSGLYETLMTTAAFVVPADAAKVHCRIQFQGAVSATVKVDNAMLVVGSVPADYAPLHPADELARCQRYYEVIGWPGGNDYVWSGYATAAGQNWYGHAPFKVSKAVAPTVTKVGTWGATNAGQPVSSSASNVGFQAYMASAAAGPMFVQNVNAGTCFTAEANP